MTETLETYTVSQLAKLAGISVRTLHHYDDIALLNPSGRTPAGYRLYGRADLLRLQQILFFRELDFSLQEIRTILDDPQFDQLAALENHRLMLQQRRERLARLLGTVDKTIQILTEDKMTLTDEELYEGFTKEEAARYKREAREKYDPEIVDESYRRARNMSKAQWQALKEEGQAVNQALAGLMDKELGDPQVQALIARHKATIEPFYHVTADIYRGLGQMYVDNEEFRAFYDKYRPGLADFMQQAMAYYADHSMAE